MTNQLTPLCPLMHRVVRVPARTGRAHWWMKVLDVSADGRFVKVGAGHSVCAGRMRLVDSATVSVQKGKGRWTRKPRVS